MTKLITGIERSHCLEQDGFNRLINWVETFHTFILQDRYTSFPEITYVYIELENLVYCNRCNFEPSLVYSLKKFRTSPTFQKKKNNFPEL